jgi:hypothetical protein
LPPGREQDPRRVVWVSRSTTSGFSGHLCHPCCWYCYLPFPHQVSRDSAGRRRHRRCRRRVLAWRTSERAVKVQEDLLQHERRKYLLTVKPEWDLWWSVEFDPDRSMSTLQTNFKFHGPEPASTFKAEWSGRLTWNEFSSAFPEGGPWKLDPPEDSLEVGATRQLDVGAIFTYMAEYDPDLLPVSEPLVSLGLIVYLTVQMVSGGDEFSCQQYLVAFRTESGWLFGETDRLRYHSALSAKSKAEFESLTCSSTDGQYREGDSPYGEEFTLDSHNENRPAE